MRSVCYLLLVTMTVSPNSMEVGLTYDDVLLIPQRSPVRSRDNVDTSSFVTPSVEVETPIISSNMHTVTEGEMAQAMSDVGAVGILHRYMPPEEQAEEIASVDGVVGGSIGVHPVESTDGVLDSVEQAELLVEAGADFVCIDIAHGHLEMCIETVEAVSDAVPVDVMAGNVVTVAGAVDLISAGADSIKVGVGPGAACRTRTVTGVGVPQFTAVTTVVEGVNKYLAQLGEDRKVCVIADGGIRTSGDMMKALMAGADAVMVGGFVAGCYEAPGEIIEIEGVEYQKYSGMASNDARSDRTDKDDVDTSASEGAETLKEVEGSVEEVITEAIWGVRSGCSYCGGETLDEARLNAKFIRTSPTTQERNGVHSVDSVEGY